MRSALLLGSVLLLLALGAAGSALALVGPVPWRGSSDSSPTGVGSSSMAAPGVSFTLATAELDGLSVTVDGTLHSTDFPIARIVWDWGDGTVEDSGFPGRHEYAQPGRYTVAVQVYDDRGTIIAAQSMPIDLTD
jgi:hypothetical protein